MMTSPSHPFKQVPADLFHKVEPQAGEVLPPLTGRWRSRRPFAEFEPNWVYLLSGNASKAAVVAGLCCAQCEIPLDVCARLFRLYSPKAWNQLTADGASYNEFHFGRCTVELTNEVAAMANLELDGYYVYAMLDVPAAMTEIAGALGGVPTFE
ncbi:hypothetical protein GCM10029964_090110 [Kibdelosporangium lantanae]